MGEGKEGEKGELEEAAEEEEDEEEILTFAMSNTSGDGLRDFKELSTSNINLERAVRKE